MADNEKACAVVIVAEEMFPAALIALPGGACVDKATAGPIMSGTGQYTEYVTQVKAALKCK